MMRYRMEADAEKDELVKVNGGWKNDELVALRIMVNEEDKHVDENTEWFDYIKKKKIVSDPRVSELRERH